VISEPSEQQRLMIKLTQSFPSCQIRVMYVKVRECWQTIAYIKN